jgi:lysophospholipase L1-like esterase
MPGWLVALAATGTSISAGTFVGSPELGFNTNLTYVMNLIAAIIGGSIVAALILPKLYNAKTITIYGFIGDRFGETSKRANSIMFLIGQLFTSGSRLFIAAIAVSVILFGSIHFQFVVWSIIILGIISTIYTMLGGIKGLLYIDAFQTLLIIFTGLVAFVIIYLAIDMPFSEIWASLTSGGMVKDPGVAAGMTAEGTFYGWSENHYGITSDITLEPTYIEGTSDFAGKTVSILGDSISTYKGYVPEGYSCFYPYPTADLGDVNQTWWMQVINKLGMKLLKNNSYSGTCVSEGTGNNSTVQDSRLKELLFGTEAPDIIIIFMGSNDCGSQYVKYDTFKNSYKVMLDKIKVLCPNSEIYIMTLPPSKLYNENDRVEYNEVIRQYAKDYNLPLVEMNNTYNGDDCSKYLVDSAHQNLAGMTKLANAVIQGMLESAGVTVDLIK